MACGCTWVYLYVCIPHTLHTMIKPVCEQHYSDYVIEWHVDPLQLTASELLSLLKICFLAAGYTRFIRLGPESEVRKNALDWARYCNVTTINTPLINYSSVLSNCCLGKIFPSTTIKISCAFCDANCIHVYVVYFIKHTRNS